MDGGTLNLSGVVAFGNNLNTVKSGPGTLQLSGTGANTVVTNLGVLVVNEGTLLLDKNGAVAVPVHLAIGDGRGSDDADVVLYSSGATGDQIANNANVSVLSTGLLDLATNSKSDTIAGLTLGVGATVSGDVVAGNTLTVTGNVSAIVMAGTTANSPASPAAKITGTLNLGSTATVLTVSDADAPVELDLPGPLTGTAGLTKAGSGRARLSGDNSGFSGPILVAQGVLQAASNTALGASTGDAGLAQAILPVWQVGLDNNAYTEFNTESGGTNVAPGSATTRDDDWYFAGNFGGTIGALAADEPMINFERAITAADPNDRIHFNLAPAQLDDTFRLVIDTVSSSLGTGVTLEVRVNNIVVHTETLTAEKTITTRAVHRNQRRHDHGR